MKKKQNKTKTGQISTYTHGPQAHIRGVYLTTSQQDAIHPICIRPITLRRGRSWESPTNETNPRPDSDQSHRCFGADASFQPRTQRTACSFYISYKQPLSTLTEVSASTSSQKADKKIPKAQIYKNSYYQACPKQATPDQQQHVLATQQQH